MRMCSYKLYFRSGIWPQSMLLLQLLFLVGHLWAALNNGTNFKIGVDKNKGSVMGGNSMTKLTGFAGRCPAVVYNCFGLLLTGIMKNSQAVMILKIYCKAKGFYGFWFCHFFFYLQSLLWRTSLDPLPACHLCSFEKWMLWMKQGNKFTRNGFSDIWLWSLLIRDQ